MLKPPLYFVSTPTDRAALTAEGSKIWCLKMKDVGAVVDDLTVQGEYEEGLAILKGVDERSLTDKVSTGLVCSQMDGKSEWTSTDLFYPS